MLIIICFDAIKSIKITLALQNTNSLKKYILCIFIPLFGLSNLNAQQDNIPIDSIYILRKLSRDDKTYTPEEQLAFAQRSYDLAKLTKVDSTILWSNIRLSVVLLNIGEYDLYVTLNRRNLKKAEELKDIKAIAICSFNLGSYYTIYKQRDSAYAYLLKSLKYNQFDDPKNKHFAYKYIADLQSELKLYLKSEQNIVIALECLEKISETEESLDDKCILYNLFGIISSEQERYKEAIKYYNKSKEIAEKMISRGFSEGELHTLIAYNNIAEVYQKQEDYTNALNYYNKALNKEYILREDFSFYPLLLINISYTKFLRGENNINIIISNLKRAYKICDTLEDNYDKTFVKLSATFYLSNIYINEQQKDSALKHANEAYKLSKSINDNELLLESLLLLSNLEEANTGKAYLKKYITLNDSITKEERNMRNKFARIEYESDQLENDNTKLTKEKKWLYSIATSILVIALLTYVLLVQRARNKALKFSKAQQKANEDIYNLILVQQHKLEEGRLQERNRVSEELHDGVLSKLFGTRLGLSFLELEGDTEDLKKFNNYLEQINTLEKDLRNLSHDLKTSELNSENDFSLIIKELLYQQTELHKLQYKITNLSLVNWKTVDDKIKVNLYRIIQEAIHNSIKHTNAKHIELDFNTNGNTLELIIRDDGKGFNTKQIRKGIGLKNIASRNYR